MRGEALEWSLYLSGKRQCPRMACCAAPDRRWTSQTKYGRACYLRHRWTALAALLGTGRTGPPGRLPRPPWDLRETSRASPFSSERKCGYQSIELHSGNWYCPVIAARKLLVVPLESAAYIFFFYYFFSNFCLFNKLHSNLEYFGCVHGVLLLCE